MIAKLDKWVYWLLLLAAFSECASEPMARHATVIVIVLFIIRIAKEPGILKRLVPYKATFLVMAGFVGALVLSAASTNHFLKSVQGSSIWYNYDMLLLACIGVCVCDAKRLRNVLLAAGASMLILDAYIFWQVMHGIMRPLPLSSRGIVGLNVFFSLFTPLFLVLGLKEKESLKVRRVYMFLTVMAWLGTFATGTRALWLGNAVVTIFIVGYHYRKAWKSLTAVLLLLAGLAAGTAGLFPQYGQRMISAVDFQNQSASERYRIWQSCIHMFLEHPALGVGAGNYTEQYQHHYILPEAKEPNLTNAHSNYFEMLAEYGGLGFLTYMIMELYVMYWAWKRRTNTFGQALFMSNLAFMIYTATEYSFPEFGAMRLYWLLLAVLMVAAQNTNNAGKTIRCD